MVFFIHSKKYGPHKVEIDDEDAERILKHIWHVLYEQKPIRLASVITNIPDGKKQKTVYLHRMLVPYDKVDHIDGNPLNNRKSNLRACNDAQNAQNSRRRINNKSGFKGVRYLKSKGHIYITAKICVNYRHIHLGCFKTLEEAARAYNEAAKKHHGEFARLNEIVEAAQ